MTRQRYVNLVLNVVEVQRLNTCGVFGDLNSNCLVVLDLDVYLNQDLQVITAKMLMICLNSMHKLSKIWRLLSLVLCGISIL